MIKPGKSPVFETPDQYQLDYEDVTFETNDGVSLSGWLIKGGTDKVIIQSHFGVQCSRCGYTQEGKGMMKNALWTSDIHFLNQASYLLKAGYSVLMYDLRNHGDSGSGTTPWVTWGTEERKDVLAAVNFITTHEDFQEASIGLLSICMGAASTTFAYGLEEEMARFNEVKALVEDLDIEVLQNHTYKKVRDSPITNLIINNTKLSFQGSDVPKEVQGVITVLENLVHD